MSLLEIQRLSDVPPLTDNPGESVVIVGSFAPIHDGHFDAAFSAVEALRLHGRNISSLVFTPNSTEYVRRKLGDDEGGWHYSSRINEITKRAQHPSVNTYVDDVSGPKAALREMNEEVLRTVSYKLGTPACRTHLVVGSDQLHSMMPHLDGTSNNAVCVLRPGRTDDLAEKLALPWAQRAVTSERLIITGRQNMENDISSTTIRVQV